MKKDKLEIPFADRGAYTIPEICASINIAKSSYYNLPLEDRPVEMLVNGSKRISRESSFDWRRRMEARAAARDSAA